ncbi:microtubule-associated proteins 1A/1B light chain 3C [Prinia subflava]|uniref:microtubule-associated proteins 1A/1B light chain 3C n=1 Tax=Prinia subflava TaxID=208062 RepID=UPI002FE25147
MWKAKTAGGSPALSYTPEPPGRVVKDLSQSTALSVGRAPHPRVPPLPAARRRERWHSRERRAHSCRLPLAAEPLGAARPGPVRCGPCEARAQPRPRGGRMRAAPGAQPERPFKLRKSLATRREEVAGIRAKFPTKIPVIVERYHKEKYLPLLDKTKFLVPEELTMAQFITIIRSRMALTATQAFYLLVNNKSLASMSLTMTEVYRDYKDEDGFVYMTYASQEMFGCLLSTAQGKTMECFQKT